MRGKRRTLCCLAAWIAVWMLFCSGCAGPQTPLDETSLSTSAPAVQSVAPIESNEQDPESSPASQMPAEDAKEEEPATSEPEPALQPPRETAEEASLSVPESTGSSEKPSGSIPEYLLPNQGRDIAGATADEAGGEQITVTLSIDCSNADGYDIPCETTILPDTEMQIRAGATAYQLLQQAAKAQGFAVAKSGGSNNVYIQGIAGLFEKDCGSGSGWMFRVNGEFPMVSAGGYKLSDGDTVEFCYTLDYGKDLGA